MDTRSQRHILADAEHNLALRARHCPVGPQWLVHEGAEAAQAAFVRTLDGPAHEPKIDTRTPAQVRAQFRAGSAR